MENPRLKAEAGGVAPITVASTGGLQGSYEAALRRRRKLYGAAPTTAEALTYSLRERGEAALIEPCCQHRLSDLSTEQVREVIQRLDRLQSKYPKITNQLLLTFGELLS
jgi:hypothetical protein